MEVGQEAYPESSGLRESLRVQNTSGEGVLTGNVAKLVVIEHRLAPRVASHPS